MLEWLLIPFIIGLMTLSHIPGWSRLMVLLGFVLTWVFLIIFLYLRLELPTEVIIYLGWIAWSFCGAINAIDLAQFKQQLITIIQVGVLIFLVTGIVALRKNMSILIFAIAAGGLVVAASSYYSGEMHLASALDSGTRAAGITQNANSLAYYMLFVVFATFYFWGIKPQLWWRLCMAATTLVSALIIIASGSRKGYLGLVVFLILWFLFCHGKKVLKRPLLTLGILLVLVSGIYYTTDYVMSSTLLGKRFEQHHMERGSSVRAQMYIEGIEMIRKDPILGVGLGNYSVLSSSGLFSHSDYIEVAANTGVVGFLLYFSIYAVLWRRLQRIKTMTKDPRILYAIGALSAMTITILLLAFGRVNITSKLTWIFLAGAIGYSWSLERILSSQEA